MSQPRFIRCPSCAGTGGPVNWMWRGSILYDVPCPLCKATGQIEDRRKVAAEEPDLSLLRPQDERGTPPFDPIIGPVRRAKP